MKQPLLAAVFILAGLATVNAQHRVSFVAEVLPAVNINAFDIQNDRNLLTIRSPLTLGAGGGIILAPSRPFELKITAGVWITPQQLELNYKESYSGKQVSHIYKHTDAYAFLKVSPTAILKTKNGNQAALGGVVCFNYCLNYVGDKDELFYEYDTDPGGGQVGLLNATNRINWGSNFSFGNGNTPLVLVTGGIHGGYEWAHVLRGRRGLRIGAELTTILGNGGAKNGNSMAIAKKIMSTVDERSVTAQSKFYDRRLQLTLMLGIRF